MMRLRFKPKLALSLVLSAIGALEAQPQPNRFEPSAAEVAVSLRTKGHARYANVVLTQTFGPKPQGQLDEIADTLVEFATGFPGNDSSSFATRRAAFDALASAGRGDSGMVGRNHTVPYAGAIVRLMRIAETAQEVGMRGRAVAALVTHPNRTASLAFLQQIAKSQNEIAWLAVHMLGNQTGAEGLAVARQLFRERSVSEERARSVLSGIASHYGWQ